MKGISTGRENQRVDFVDSLYKSLKKKAKDAVGKHNKMCSLASVYLSDGLSPEECVELMIIEGNLTRSAAISYVDAAQSDNPIIDDGEYSFQFEDVHGKVWSSYEIGSTVRASSDDDAWNKAEEIIFTNLSVEPDKVVSVNRIS